MTAIIHRIRNGHVFDRSVQSADRGQFINLEAVGRGVPNMGNNGLWIFMGWLHDARLEKTTSTNNHRNSPIPFVVVVRRNNFFQDYTTCIELTTTVHEHA